MPVSVTATSIAPSSRLRPVTVTDPPSGVYFTALSMRLIRIWARRSRSAETSRRSAASRALTVTRARAARGAMMSITEPTTSAMRTRSRRSVTLPSSMLDRSVRSLSRRPSRSLCRSTISRKRRAFSRSSSAPERSVSR